MTKASGEQLNGEWAVWVSDLLAILLILIFAVSLFALSPASAQTGIMDEDPTAGGPVDEAMVTRLQAAYETRLETLFEKARQTGKARVIVQLRTPFRSQGLLDDAKANDQRAAIAAQQNTVVERLAQRFDIDKTVINRFETIPYFALAVDEQQLEALRMDPDVAAIEEDVALSPTLIQSIPLIEADVAHNLGYAGAGQVVAVLDTGVIKDHPFLAGKVVSEACYSSRSVPVGEIQSLCPGGVLASTASGSARDCPPFIHGCGHGTHVAGIVVGRNNSGNMSGVAPDARIIAIKVFSLSNIGCDGQPCAQALSSNIMNGLGRVLALSNTYKIAAVNLSLGGEDRYYDTATCDSANSGLKALIDKLRAVGIATVVASGNKGWNDSLSAPACISTAISVGATTKSDQVASYSNSAWFLDLLAPGGNGDLPSPTSRIFSSGVVASAVSVGSAKHVCGVRGNDTLACWGANHHGQASPPSGTFTQVSTGYLYTCGVRSDGTLACWGFNQDGQASPPSGTFTQVSAGSHHTCGVRGNGTLACWGKNVNGEVSPPSGTFTQVSASYYHTCGVRGNGTLACWGFNGQGQASPPSGTFTQVSAGAYHTCGIKSDGTLACWGYNGDGQASPPSGTFTQVSAGGPHTCGVRGDGTLACWGNNANGEASPPSGTFTQVSASYWHTCGVRGNGTLACWGNNDYGQASPPADPWAGYQFLAGTSMAAPHVAGAWAVLKSKKPNASVSVILAALQSTGKPITDSRNGVILPRIDVAAALDTLTPCSLRVTDVSKAEGNAGTTAFAFTVTLSPASSGPVTVKYATANGTATAGSDYTAASGTLTFAPGQTSQTVTVNVTGNTTVEPNEAFAVNLSTASGATIFDGQGVGTILNDDGPVLRINDVSKAEGNAGTTPFTFTVTLSPASASTVTVKYATANGTALAGSDYAAASGTLTFAPGQTSQTVTVNVLGNATVEPNETFAVNLSAATGATIADGQGVGTILNDDGPVLRVNDVTKAEGSASMTAFTFTVTLLPASTGTVTVNYATANGTAAALSDYAAVPATLLTFSPGQTSKTVTVSVFGGTTVEPNETFAVNLSAASGATIFDSQGVGTILNDDGPVLRVNDVTKAEGSAGTTAFTFTVTLSPASTGTVTVKYATANGTAAAGSDYTATSGTLTFAPGQTSKTVPVNVLGNATVEPNEAFFINLSAASGATIFDGQGVGTILNDD